MKKFIVTILATLALSGLWAAPSALTQGAPDKKVAPTQEPNTAAFDKQLAQVQEQMKVMQAQMDQIRQTQDPQQRQRLLQQHWASMQSAMNAMHGLWGPGMMGGSGMMGPGGMMGGTGSGCCGGGWGHMGGYYSHLTPEQLRQRQYMSEQYLNMQQMMMNHMMWDQQYRTGPGPRN
ncbi:MAG: hypothetical protein B7X39_19600 [Lysobacterales bacterium 14-68-21]|jgi:hypothetical protein|nr:MAG: hypothetical protein B7X39_19600 [Xanthomonadales bacterium 14-68-21]